jgi:hypothetical protein
MGQSLSLFGIVSGGDDAVSNAQLLRSSVAVLLLIHAALLLDASRKNFVTVDEAGHLVAGISHWTTGTYSMYRVNPPLARMLAVIPVFLLHPNTQGIQPTPALGERAEWRCANQFALDNAPRYLDILFLARLAGIFWSCLGGWLVYRWGCELYSYRAGLLGLVLWCFDPNVLANAQMVTPDVPATVAGFAATYCFWRYLRQPSWSSALLTGLVLGIAELTKFTLLYLYALWPLLWLIQRYLDRRDAGPTDRRDAGPTDRRDAGPTDRRDAGPTGQAAISFWQQVWHGLAMVGVSVGVINLGYEFQDTGKPLGQYVFGSRTLGGEAPKDVSYGVLPINRFKDHWYGAIPVPVPSEFLAGIDRQKVDFEQRLQSYLHGQWQRGGWWYYYLYGLAVKMPLGVLALVVWGLILTLIGHASSGRLVEECFVWLPVLTVLVLVSSQTGFNHHLRYVLPIFPFAFLGAGKLAHFFSRQRWKPGLLVLVLVLWSIIGTIRIHPHYLSYFNEAVGGPQHGYEHLVDSNIDWGQDLLFLKSWLDQHPEAHPLGLAYFNIIDPRVVGISFSLPPPGPGETNPVQDQFGPRPGYYALDVNFVCGASFPAIDGQGHSHFIFLHQYEYFQHFQPIAKAGYSIFIYHITLPEANAVRQQLGLPPLTAQDLSPETTP